jgi:hypothetical protein
LLANVGLEAPETCLQLRDLGLKLRQNTAHGSFQSGGGAGRSACQICVNLAMRALKHNLQCADHLLKRCA